VPDDGGARAGKGTERDAADPERAPMSDRLPVRNRSAWWGRFGLGFEFALLFAVALFVIHALAPELEGAYPSPLWLPVIALSLQHGLAAGIAAAAAAVGLYVWEGLPPAALTEDIYQYVARIAAAPVGWTCAALLFGHVRNRQIDETSGLQAELREREDQCVAVAAHCEDLKGRAQMLERHIAANVQASSIDVAEAITGLHEANWENFQERLARFILVLTGANTFSLYLLRGDSLKLTFQVRDETAIAPDFLIAPDDSLFTAVVNERAVLSATRAADRDLLDGRGVLVGPLVDQTSRAIGMLRLGGADLVDFPEDIERRFALARTEIARLLGRVILVETVAPPQPVGATRPVGRLEQLHVLARREAAGKAQTLDSIAS
jgi:hypothetical protein